MCETLGDRLLPPDDLGEGTDSLGWLHSGSKSGGSELAGDVWFKTGCLLGKNSRVRLKVTLNPRVSPVVGLDEMKRWHPKTWNGMNDHKAVTFRNVSWSHLRPERDLLHFTVFVLLVSRFPVAACVCCLHCLVG